jgi:MATE family multidrug resistance protein
MGSAAEGTDGVEGARGARLRALLALAWPIVVSRSSQVVVGISDAVMVAHLGAASLAATTAGALNAFTFFILPMGTVFIVSSFSSQLFGMGDLAGARRYAWHGMAVAAGTAVLSAASIPLVPTLLAPLPYAADVRVLMEDYLAIRLLSADVARGTCPRSGPAGSLSALTKVELCWSAPAQDREPPCVIRLSE